MPVTSYIIQSRKLNEWYCIILCNSSVHAGDILVPALSLCCSAAWHYLESSTTSKFTPLDL